MGPDEGSGVGISHLGARDAGFGGVGLAHGHVGSVLHLVGVFERLEQQSEVLGTAQGVVHLPGLGRKQVVRSLGIAAQERLGEGAGIAGVLVDGGVLPGREEADDDHDRGDDHDLDVVLLHEEGVCDRLSKRKRFPSAREVNVLNKIFSLQFHPVVLQFS